MLNTSIDMNNSIRFSATDGNIIVDGMDYLGLSSQPKFQQMIGQCKIYLGQNQKFREITFF
jgi:hypothetical protein